MSTDARSGVTFIDLEFETGTRGGALLGDIASSLVSVDELLRDLASIAAYQSSVEFRKVEIVAIEMRSPLKIRLSLVAISPEATTAFQEICRDIILFRAGRLRPAAPAIGDPEDANATRLAGIRTVVERYIPQAVQARITEQEAERLAGHIATRQDAEIPLKRVEVKEE
jgi:hypothetical protein